MAYQTNSQLFLPVAAASVATPATGVVKFLDAATGHLSQKDSAGVVTDLAASVGSSPPQIDLSSYSGADVALALGQNAIYTFNTAITSLPLKIACADNQSYKIEGFFTREPASADSQITLSPNNTTLGTSIRVEILFAQNPSTLQVNANGGFASGLSTFQLSANLGKTYNFSALVNTKTNGKSVVSESRQQSLTADALAKSSSLSDDTTTVWSSLGTITFPTGYAGRVVVTKLSDASAGGGVPGLIAAGSGTEVQYRNGGTFAAASNVSIEQGVLALLPQTLDPTTPTLSLLLYTLDIAGRKMLKYVGPSGVDSPIQGNLFFSNFSLLSPGNGTAISAFQAAVTTVGTVSHPALAATNLKTQTRRFVVTSAATAGAFSDMRVPYTECWRGNVANQGGFFQVLRFGLATLVAGNRGFFGLTNSIAALTNIDPLADTTLSKIGVGFNLNTGNLFLINNNAGTAPTTLDLGANFPINYTNFYEAIFFAKPNGADVAYRIRNMTLNNPATDIKGTLTTNLPANTTFLARRMYMTNNATASAVVFDISRFGLETDY